ncbi:MAG: recombinase family protein, partial [Bacteroidetes bacterium]|nr:recombinase family protein [Bacteroidota bacterium]
MKNKKQVGLWIRVSSSMQVERESHTHHEIRGKSFISSRDWHLKKIYRLEAMSGKSIKDYPQTKEMLADIKAGVITGLVFSKIARLARNTKELIEISEIFREHNADLISMDMSIDTSTAIGRHFFRQMSSMAEWEREMIADRISASVQTRAELGKQLGGQAPFGFKYVNKRLVIDEEEAPVRKLMFELFLEHKRKKTVARLLNDMGYRTRRGNLFTDSTVKRLLTDPVAKGLHVMNRRYSSGTKPNQFKPKEAWVFHKVEAIVSEEIWDTVNGIVKSQIKTNKKPLNTIVNLFTGFVFCECGGRMYTRSSSDFYLCQHHCGNKIHKEDLEVIFKDELHAYTVSEKNVEEYFGKIKKIMADKEKQLNTLKKDKEQLDNKIENLLQLHIQGQIKTEAFHSYHQQPYEQLMQIGETISELELELRTYISQETSTAHILEEAKNLYERWDTLSHQQKRTIIEIITEKIIVGNDEIEINLYKILPDG